MKFDVERTDMICRPSDDARKNKLIAVQRCVELQQQQISPSRRLTVHSMKRAAVGSDRRRLAFSRR
jgi:hypothetical protein